MVVVVVGRNTRANRLVEAEERRSRADNSRDLEVEHSTACQRLQRTPADRRFHERPFPDTSFCLGPAAADLELRGLTCTFPVRKHG